ncbi:hypothetical protein OEZ86_003618 [Tetradesmus obliquus]|nr:hypothetical protein OEZ86_003618 [Tetradesmus obliquus]
MALLLLVAGTDPTLPELACEPSAAFKIKVPVAWLDSALPQALHPSNCSVAAFAGSNSRCGLLRPTDKGCVKLRPVYMHTLRRHSLLRRLLGQLLRYGRGCCRSPEMNISLLGSGLVQARELRLLQPYRLPYRLLYSRLVGFVADMVSGGDEVLVDLGCGPQQGPQLLLPAAELLHNPMYRCARPVTYAPHGKDKRMMTRDVAQDSGWVGGHGSKQKRGREFV